MPKPWPEQEVLFLVKGLDGPGIIVMNGRRPGDLLKPSMIFRIESNSRTIQTSTQNQTSCSKGTALDIRV